MRGILFRSTEQVIGELEAPLALFVDEHEGGCEQWTCVRVDARCLCCRAT